MKKKMKTRNKHVPMIKIWGRILHLIRVMVLNVHEVWDRESIRDKIIKIPLKEGSVGFLACLIENR